MPEEVKEQAYEQLQLFSEGLFHGELEFSSIRFEYTTDGMYSVVGSTRPDNREFSFPLWRDDLA